MTERTQEKDARQEREPFLEACVRYMDSDPVCFDVPAHKMGGIVTDLVDYSGKQVFKADFNAPIGLDNLYHPRGVIKEAEDLAAEAFQADKALFSVNGTTGGILTIMLSILRPKDKIILPRNVHKSVINGLILSGATPVFVSPDCDPNTGISNGVAYETYLRAMEENYDAKAVFVLNPTYFGIVSDLKRIVEAAHAKDMVVMCDEAHGSHFAFSNKMPISAMEAGADITTMSVHKTGGSLTQSSLILCTKGRIDISRVERAFAMLSSTSPNHILLASLDAARKYLYFHGREKIEENIELANYARKEISKIPGLSVLDSSYCDRSARFNMDLTKLVIEVSGLGITGFEVRDILKRDYNIQLELAEISEVLAIVGLGSTKEDINRLVYALSDLSKKRYSSGINIDLPHFNYEYPNLVVRPREAYNAPCKIVPLEDALGEISAESIMIYPPGIPICIPGEMVTKNALELVEFYLKNGGVLLSDSSEGYIKVIDQQRWYKSSDIDIDL